MKFSIKEDGKRIIAICLAAVLMALNIKSFVRTGGLYPGGVTGVTLLIQRAAQLFFHITIPYTAVNILLNACPVYIGFRFIGKKFTLYSCLMIVLTSVLTDLIPGYVITYDTLLIAVFGGMINGLVISLCLSVNATTGGTDFVAIYLSEKKGIDSWNIVLGINVVILGAAGLLFGWDKALYSIIFQFTSTQMVQMLHQRYKKHTLFIITRHPDEVYEEISKLSHHSATRLDGTGCYRGDNTAMIYSVVSREEAKLLVKKVAEVDPQAFVNIIKTDFINGRFYYKTDY